MPGRARDDLEPLIASLRRRFPLRGNDVVLELSDIADDGYGVWLRINFVAATTYKGSVMLMASSAFDDPRRDAFVQGWIDALQIVLRGAVTPLSAASIDVRFPLEAARDMTAAGFRDELLKSAWLGKHLPAHKRTPKPPFEKAPSARMLRDGQIDLDATLMWVRAQVDVGWQDAARDRGALAAVPEPARVLWLLGTFEGDVYNGGLAGFLQQSEWVVHGCRDALRAVGADALLALLDSARDGEDVAAGLLEHELRPRLAAYCDRHRGALID